MANFSDSFTDTNGTLLTAHTPDAGTGWTESGDASAFIDAEIQNNQARPSSNRANQDLIVHADPDQSSADYTVKATIKGLQEANSRPLGLIARYTDDDNFYLAEILPGEDQFKLWVKNAGTPTQLGSTINQAPAVNDVVELIVSGTTISVKVNSTEIISVTNSVHSSAGAGGLFWGDGFTGNSVNQNNEFDDFSITEAAAGGGRSGDLLLLGVGS